MVTLRLDKEEQNEGREEKQQLRRLRHVLLSVHLIEGFWVCCLWHGTVPVMPPGSIYRGNGRGVGEVSVQLQSADQTVLCMCINCVPSLPLLVLCFWSTE